MKRIRILIIFSFIIILSFASCSPKEETIETTETYESTAAIETVTEQTKYEVSYLPDVSYDGYVFRVLSCAYPNGFSIMTLADAEEQSGEIINDAIYLRNLEIEQEYGITFKADYANEFFNMTQQLKKSVLGGSDDYDLNMLICRDAFSVAQEGMIVPVEDMPYADISQPWYVQTINEALTIGNKLYFAYSDDAINLFEWTNLVLFNKSYADSYSLGDLYELVRSGKWTIEKFFACAKSVVTDLDGDGKYNDLDLLGIISQNDFYYPSFWVSSDLDTVQKDKDDIPFLAVDGNEKFFKLLTDIVNYTTEDGIFFDTFSHTPVSINKGTGDEQRVAGHVLFANGVSLFEVTNVGALQSMREMDNDFGILPIPKYDEAQQNYRSRTIDGWLYCVPMTNSDLERTSVIMEAMAVGAKNIIVPAYYEVALKEKYTRDLDSKEMFELIYNTRAFDMGDVYWMDAIRNVYVPEMIRGNTEFVSITEKRLGSMNKVIADAIEALAS